MKFSMSITALSLLATALAAPAETRDDVQTVHLTFHGGPASYDMAIPANGESFDTNNDISVSIIDAPDYNALSQCTFKTAGKVTLAQNVVDGLQQISVGPPQPIISVSCEGSCVPTWGQCYGTDGQYVGPCCNGFCAASRCRPWNISA